MASTTTLSSSQPSTSEPQLDVQYCAPEFCLPPPDNVNQFCRDQSNLIFYQGVIIVKISPKVVVKFGAHVNITEAKTKIHAAQNTGVPVPKFLACYMYGPIDHYGILTAPTSS
ncbi:hypothetical protein HAV15_000396 [Penicillium sp. str. |nr:hypothetical protein HAV15_000396 [Penicillium sp. str. \